MGASEELKIVHIADLHLGSYFHEMGFEKRRERINDFFRNLDRITRFAIENRCDFVVMAGDIFSNPLPRGEVFNRFAKLVGRLIENRVKVVVVAGNHDTPPSLVQRNTALSLHLAGVKGFIYVDQRSDFKPIVLKGENSGKTVAFYAIPFVYPEILSPDNPLRDLEQKVFEMFDRQLVDREVDYRVGVGHFTVEGSKYSERVEPRFTYELKVRRGLLRQLIKIGDVDYFALGHIHLHQFVERKAAYSGSIERITLGETEDKGFILLREGRGELVPEFVPLPCRDVKLIGGDFLDFSRPWVDEEYAIKKLREIPEDEVRGSMVKLSVVYDPASAKRISWRKLSSALYQKGAFYVKVDRRAKFTGAAKKLPRGKGAEKKLEELMAEYVRSLPELRGKPRLAEKVLSWARKIIEEVELKEGAR